MIVKKVSASVMKPERTHSRWSVYSVGSRGKTYRAYNQPGFTSEVEAKTWAKKYGNLYDEITDVLYKGEPPLKNGRKAQ